jgi:hypothetical protein
MSICRIRSLCIVALLVATAGCGNDMPDVDPESATDPTVEVIFDFGQQTFGENDYMFVEALMRGTVERDDGSTGEYEVPIRLAYPLGGGNGIGVVEPVNSGLFLQFANEEGVAHDCGRGPMDECEDGETTGRLIQSLIHTYADRQTGGSMFREGFTYLAIGWDKSVTDQLGPEPPDGTTRRRLAYGTIEEGADRVTIFRDASDWLRGPSGFEGHGAPDVPAQDHVVAFGMSQSAAVPGTFFRDGQNETENGGIYFDGFLGMSGLWFCIAEEQTGPNWALLEPCSGPVPTGEMKLLHPDRIAEEYPTREAYAERYLASVDALVDEGYILEEDYERYRARAEGTRSPSRRRIPPGSAMMGRSASPTAARTRPASICLRAARSASSSCTGTAGLRSCVPMPGSRATRTPIPAPGRSIPPTGISRTEATSARICATATTFPPARSRAGATSMSVGP